MKRQRRYTTEQQILDAIDQCKANAARLTHDSAALQLESNAYIEKAYAAESAQDHGHASGYRDLAKKRLKQSLKMDKRAVNIMEKKLPKLARTLEGFRTTPMPFIDQSVVEAK